MIQSKGYAAQNADSLLSPYEFERQDVAEGEILIDIAYCGVCHSDVHQVRNEWGGSIYPMVPGHEIVGKVTKVGNNVKKFRVGDLAGVGCMVDSCLQCSSCHENKEQFCDKGPIFTYNSHYYGSERPTQGGYSNNLVVREEFALTIPDNLPLASVAPLLCAGITTYSPLRRWNVSPGQRIGIVGLGGLGHMAIKFAHAFGAHVIVFTHSENKRQAALNLGADEVILSSDTAAMAEKQTSLDVIIDTVSATHNINEYLTLLKRDCPMVMLGVPQEPQALAIGALLFPTRILSSSLIGGIKETQEMLNYCGEHNIVADIELIPIDKINDAYERMLRSDVKYRFVIDMSTL